MFNNNSRILAIKPSGNVFAAEAVEELNYKAKSWNDLLTGEEFTKKVRGAVVRQGSVGGCSMEVILTWWDGSGGGGGAEDSFVVRGGDEVSVLSLEEIASRKSFPKNVAGGVRVEGRRVSTSRTSNCEREKLAGLSLSLSRAVPNPIKPKPNPLTLPHPDPRPTTKGLRIYRHSFTDNGQPCPLSISISLSISLPLPLSPPLSFIFHSIVDLHVSPPAAATAGGDQAQRPWRQGVRGVSGHQQLRAPIRGTRGARGGTGQGGARRQDQANQVHRANFPVRKEVMKRTGGGGVTKQDFLLALVV